jgi:hypothetical protein
MPIMLAGEAREDLYEMKRNAGDEELAAASNQVAR